jgi:hypothetical protein
VGKEVLLKWLPRSTEKLSLGGKMVGWRNSRKGLDPSDEESRPFLALEEG